jgi:hypothetical protein
MSEQARNLIANAVSTVDGVNVTPYFRQTTKAGEGMVRLDVQRRDDARFYLDTWQVLVVLPQDIAAAEKWLDANLVALREAAREQLVVLSITPQDLLLDTGKVPVVVIEGVREAD